MISFDFAYLRPESLEEALQAFREEDRRGREPFWYAGGSEIVSFCRQGRIRPGAVIDIKAVPECRVLTRRDRRIRLGAALCLNELIAANPFPLLSRAAAGIADYTLRNRITLGGNAAGMLPYREALLPLLAAGGRVECAGPDGRRSLPLARLFDRRLRLERGELLVAFEVDAPAAAGRWFYRRRVQGTPTDYPLLSACFLVREGEIRMALSGVASHPLRDEEADTLLNRASLAPEARARAVLDLIGAALKDDLRGSAAYRRHLLKLTLLEALRELGGES